MKRFLTVVAVLGGFFFLDAFARVVVPLVFSYPRLLYFLVMMAVTVLAIIMDFWVNEDMPKHTGIIIVLGFAAAFIVLLLAGIEFALAVAGEIRR